MFTDVEVTWLVNENACEGTDYDRGEVAWFWDVTTIQDKTITEDNQLGIRSSRYQPGRYSEHEGRVQVFLKWYLANLSSV